MKLLHKGNTYNYEEIREYLEERGFTKSDVQRRTGISQTNLDRIIKKYNIKYLYGGRTVNHADVLSMLKSGMKKSNIARKCNCSRQTVINIAKDNGLMGA